MTTKVEHITIYHQTDTVQHPEVYDHWMDYGCVSLETFPYIDDLPSIRVETKGKNTFEAEDLYSILDEIPALLEAVYKLGQQNPNVDISQYWK